jgi:predicted DNA-binding mobile mystery protein A
MTTAKTNQARSRLDKRISRLGHGGFSATPPKGWVRAIRDALGMTTPQLGARLGITQQSASGLERSEASGTISVNTLRRAAEALNCRLVYALVPETSLAEIFDRQARLVALRDLERVEHSMRLEDQGTSSADREERITNYIRDVLRDRDIWRPR